MRRLADVSLAFASSLDHAWEATEAIKPLLGPHYLSSDENMFVSLWKTFRQCRVRPALSPPWPFVSRS